LIKIRRDAERITGRRTTGKRRQHDKKKERSRRRTRETDSIRD